MTPFDTYFPITKIHSILDMSWTASSRKASGEGRPYHAISIRLNGSAKITHNDLVTNVNAGDILFLPRNFEYTIDSFADEHIICFHFDLDESALSKNNPTSANLSIGIYKPIDSTIFVNLFNQLLKVWNEKKPGYEYRAMSLANTIIETVITEKKQKSISTVSNLFDNILLYTNTHFTYLDFSVESLARDVNISEVYLRRLFKSQMGISPHEYITNLRINHAKELLRSGYYTVSETANLSGYKNVKNFTVAFHKQTGQTPSMIIRTNTR